MRVISAAIALTRSALRWWLGELAALIPDKIRRVFSAEPDRIVAEHESGKTVLYMRRRRGWDCIGQIDAAAGELPDFPNDLASKTRQKKLRMTVAVRPESVVTREVELPIAAEENLREVVGFEIERLTPFKEQDVYFDYRVRERDVARGKLTASLTISPRDKLDMHISEMAGLGLVVDCVDISTGKAGTLLGLNLLPPTRARKSSTVGRTIGVVALASAAVVAVAVVLVPLDRKARYDEILRQQMVEAKAKATLTQNLKNEIVKLKESGAFVYTLRRDTALVSEALDTTTKLLPDGTWLFQLRLAGEKLEIGGFSPDSSELINIFEESPYYSDVKFGSSVTQDPALNLERFNLTMRTTFGAVK